MISRRSMLLGGAALFGVGLPLSRLFGRTGTAAVGRYGPLVSDPEGILDLPRGFSYRIVQKKYALMSDGYRVPGSFDGMACFAGPGDTLVLMRNHENTWLRAQSAYRDGQKPPPEAYDPAAYGGVTRLVLRADTLEPVSSNLVLTGTVRNCAGGPSPWGWLSCEEATDTSHGYVFLCRTDAARVTPPRKITGYGRCRHEAAAVDPKTHIAYLTEDQGDGCLYRFVPDDPARPFAGRLQAMRATERPALETGEGLAAGDRFDVDWVDIADPDPDDDTLRVQAYEQGAARIRRGEGIWLSGDEIHFSSTTGGPAEAGQIFRLTLGRGERPDALELLAQSESTDILDMPDNLTLAPWGDVYLAEDSVGGDQYVRVVDRQGRVYDFARNAVSQSELAGVCFSPQGDTLFVNIYGDGLTLAIRGPFQA